MILAFTVPTAIRHNAIVCPDDGYLQQETVNAITNLETATASNRTAIAQLKSTVQKAHSRARHGEHQARCCPETSMIQTGRLGRTKPRTRTQSRRYHTNPCATNRRRFVHQDRQPRPGAAHTLLLDMRPRMQA